MKASEIQYFKDSLIESLNLKPSTAIFTHVNPDGDGFAAALALKEILASLGFSAHIFLEEEISEIYDFLEGRTNSMICDPSIKFANIIILDCHELSRIGNCAKMMNDQQNVFILDHHEMVEPIMSKAMIIDTGYVSVGVMIYDIFTEIIQGLPAKSACYVAQAIYTTILNDSGNFINANTDEKTFKVSADLMKLGLIPGEVAEQFLLNKTPAELSLVGEVLEKLEVKYNGKVLFIQSDRDQLQKRSLKDESTDKMTNWVKGARGVDVVVYFRESGDNQYKISLRSNKVNVNKIARKYGGGGHIKASGCSIEGELVQIKEMILQDIIEQY